ncbi:hypothetical protein M3Y97_00829000 [Aphelenchoides bicaudatus]|nr:hypothetical protein M3Y97_00829000 [Aphelenchoides bicaudatus]
MLLDFFKVLTRRLLLLKFAQLNNTYRRLKLPNTFACLLLLTSFQRCVAASRDFFEQYESNVNNLDNYGFYCYSCASTNYLSLWKNQLIRHYYPPKNFTEECWKPEHQVGLTYCRSACFTLVEEIHDFSTQEGVLRGCLDRFMLFGLDPDIKRSISGLRCQTMYKKLFSLVPLNEDVPFVLFCPCVGNVCNNDQVESSSALWSRPNLFAFVLGVFVSWK